MFSCDHGVDAGLLQSCFQLVLTGEAVFDPMPLLGGTKPLSPECLPPGRYFQKLGVRPALALQ